MYVYQADVWCDGCAKKICQDLAADGKTPENRADETAYDSDDYPKGPYYDDQTEADCPHHCRGCGEFLGNSLTSDGYGYVRTAVREACEQGRWGSVALTDWLPFYDVAFPTSVGEGDRAVILVNPLAWEHCYVLCFGAYGWTRLAVWAASLEDALDEAIDWLADHKPGLLCDDTVNAEFNRLVAERDAAEPQAQLQLTGRARSGQTDEELWEDATADTTCGGNCGHYLNSWEWGIIAEQPTPQEWRAIFD